MIPDSDFPTDPKERQAFIAAHLSRELGIPFQAALGVTQRLIHESGANLDAGVQENKPVVPGSRGGVGYAQWTGPRRTDFESAVSGIGGVKSPSANLAYLTADLKQNYPDLIRSLQDPKTTSATAYQNFNTGYEQGKGPFAARQAQPVKMAKGPDPLDFENLTAPPAAAPQPTQTAGPGGAQTATIKPQESVSQPAPAVAQKPSGDPLDFENLTAPPAAPAAPTPSADNPNEGKNAPTAAPTGPQPSLLHDVGAGLVQGARGAINAITNPSQMIIGPLARVGAAGYNLLAPHVGLPQMTPEQMADINGTGTENGGVNTGTPGQLVTKGVGAALGAPQPEEVPPASPMLRNTVANATAGATLGGPAVGTAAGIGTPVVETASSFVPPQYQPAAEDLMALPLFGGMTSMLRPKVPEILPSVAKTAQDAAAAGGPEFRVNQLAKNPATAKADLRDNAEATGQQVHDFTKAVTKQAGVPSDTADSAWVQKVYKQAGDRLDAVAAKTPVTVSQDMANDLQAAQQKFRQAAQSADPSIAAQGQKLISNLATAFTKNNGTVTGKDFQQLTSYKSELSQYARQPGAIGDLARDLKDALQNQLERNAKPEDVAEIRAARQQWNTARRLEPMVNDTTGILDPRRVAREFGGDASNLGSIAASGGLLPNAAPTGGVRAPGMTLPKALALTVGSPLAALEAHNLLTQYGGMLAEHPYLTALGALGAGGAAAAAGARKIGAAYMNRPDQQRALIARAAMGAPPPGPVNMLVPGVLGTQGQNQ